MNYIIVQLDTVHCQTMDSGQCPIKRGYNESTIMTNMYRNNHMYVAHFPTEALQETQSSQT